MDTLQYIKNKYQLRYRVPMPIKLDIERHNEFLTLLSELGLRVGVEIGTARGLFAEWMFKRIKKLKLYCIDPWIAYPRYVEMCDEEGQKIYDDMFSQAQKKLAGKNVEFIRKYSIDAVKDFKDESLDFVYIDGNHTFEYVIQDIAEWERKVRKGGIVSGHDYWNSIKSHNFANQKIGIDYHEPTSHIEKMKLCQGKDAVDAWTKTNCITPWFTTKSYKTGTSWFYVKV
jgi:hypothetical protein